MGCTLRISGSGNHVRQLRESLTKKTPSHYPMTSLLDLSNFRTHAGQVEQGVIGWFILNKGIIVKLGVTRACYGLPANWGITRLVTTVFHQYSFL